MEALIRRRLTIDLLLIFVTDSIIGFITTFHHHLWELFLELFPGIGSMQIQVQSFGFHTVVGRNPAPPGMYKTLQIMEYLPYQLVQDFFHHL